MQTFRVLSRVVVLLVVCVVVREQAMSQVPSVNFSITGGLALPMGDFASTTSTQAGAAATGFGVGVNLDVSVIPMLTAVGSFSYVSNGLNEDYIKDQTGGLPYTGDVGSWTTLWPMVGLKYSAGIGPVASVYFTAQGGVMFGTSPEVNITSGGITARYKSFSSSGFAYSLGAGVKIADKFLVEVRLLSAQPEYDYELSAAGPGFTTTVTSAYDQPTSIIQINAGISL